MSSLSIAMEKGLPASLDAERLVLGSILLDENAFLDVAGSLSVDDFCFEKHRKIFRRMGELHNRAEHIDRVTVGHELMRHGELEAVDGMTYITSLDDGLPRIPNLSAYVKIIKDKATLRRVVDVANKLMTRAMIGEEDPKDILAGAEENLLRLGQAQISEGLLTPREIIEKFQGGINAFLDPSKRIKGTSTGFSKFDEMTGGLHAGELVILAARPSMGKTALALNIAHHVACRLNLPTAIFSLEMSNDSLLSRMICAAARVDSHKYRMGFLDDHERHLLRKAANHLVGAPLYIDDRGDISLLEMHAKLRKLQQQCEQPLGLVIVDYLQLMNCHSERGGPENRTQQVSALSRGLKLMAKDLNCPMLVLSQLSRAPETRQGDHRPQLSDLRESGSIEQDADLVGFIFREEVYKKDRADLEGLAELIISKQRNGPIGIVELVYLKSMTKFENRAEHIAEPE